MFTGLVLGTGTVRSMERRGPDTRLRIEAGFDLPDIVQGESIAVSGVCLTAETFGPGWFTAFASAETLSVTNLGRLRVGSLVNLERAMAMGDRLGGHMVSGHVDCLAEVASVTPSGQSVRYRLSFPRERGVEVVTKGSVALDGISLTVNDCGLEWLEVNIIPETRTVTTVGRWDPGRPVNMETDLIAKYVRRMLGAWVGEAGDGGDAATSGIDESFLRKHGF